MYRSLLLSFLFFIVSASARSQTNANEAKAAYLLAEESYAKSDYPATLNFLESAKKSLGGANSKILYLQIQAQAEMAKTDAKLTSNVLQTITAFEAAPDIKTFNEDKVMEVLKMKLELKAKNEELAEKEKKAANAVAKGRQNFEAVTYPNWPFQTSFTQLKISHKDSILFEKKPKERFEKETGLTLYSTPAASFSGSSVVPDIYVGNNIFGVLVKADTVKGYRRVRYHADQQTGVNYNEGGKLIKGYIQGVTDALYEKPLFKVENENANYDQYTWTHGNKIFTLYHLHRYVRPTFWIQSVVSEIRYK
nr:hypothetical protein [uncultured Mucilaginibacter sp.]